MVIGDHWHPRLAVRLAFKLFDDPLEGFFGRLAVGKANPAEDRAKRLRRDACSYSLYLFKSRKDDALSPALLSRAKAGNCRFDERLNLSASSRRVSRSEQPLNQPTAILATNSKMGNIFLHPTQAIDLLRERPGQLRAELWKSKPIGAFVMVAQRWAVKISSMPSSFASLFRKTAGCPTSQALLAYHRCLLVPEDCDYIEPHLASCDFCSAELQLLTRFRSETEEYSFAEMPAQLRRLAEDLLKRSTEPFRGFAELGENR
jgi:hypothetical protein